MPVPRLEAIGRHRLPDYTRRACRSAIRSVSPACGSRSRRGEGRGAKCRMAELAELPSGDHRLGELATSSRLAKALDTAYDFGGNGSASRFSDAAGEAKAPVMATCVRLRIRFA